MQRESNSQRSTREQEVRSRQRALKHCANWDAGKCSGCMIKCQAGTSYQIIDAKLTGKDCNPVGCKYYENVVIPVLLP